MNYRRVINPGGTFFFTVVTFNRLHLLTRDDHVDLLREAFHYVTKNHPFRVDACVVLPDHLHTIWTLPDDDHDYSTRWRLIKSYFSHRLPEQPSNIPGSRAAKEERAVWQRRFWEHAIRDQRDFENHLNYLHYNPVKHGLASSPMDWPYSSFGQWVKRGVYPPDWGSSALNFELIVSGE